MNSINEALMLMAVGMGTVFIALLLVIFCGKALIAIVNRWFPEKTDTQGNPRTDTIPARMVAVITTAVNIASGGRAKIVKIEKTNNK